MKMVDPFDAQDKFIYSFFVDFERNSLYLNVSRKSSTKFNSN